MNQHEYDVIIIGSGCAGLNAADCLYHMGITNIALITEGMNMGTSRNAGSDKQTYYKLAITSDAADSVLDMAETLYAGGAVNGDTALVESANSLHCFFKLVQLGVPFPKNEYGEYVGYQTDHDENKRATSAGPLTSKYMTEVLEAEIRKNNIKIFDHTVICRIFAKQRKINGALGYNTKTNEYELFFSRFIVMATGGSAYLYRDKVYPHSQSGMSGLAIEAGAKTANLTEWQYGLASTDFRWNVSGTYQQVLPRYVSVDEKGTEYEFLTDYFKTPMDGINTVFQKGYQWPFDSRKLNGSSMIDVLVYREMQKGRSVYMDFRSNPAGLDWAELSEEAYEYLKSSNALFGKPVDRLAHMNQKAIDLYRANGIDLYQDMLKIAVCAQHQNGGIAVNSNYETSIRGLYAVGEAAGVFGIYRPGGTALNSTQVSSLRAAETIAAVYKKQESENEVDKSAIKAEAERFIREIFVTEEENCKLLEIQKEIQGKMSEYAGFIRNPQEIAELLKTVRSYKSNFFERIGSVSENQVYLLFKLRDMLITAETVLLALKVWCRDISYRGGAVVPDVKKECSDKDGMILCTERGKVFWETPREIPQSETWFETVYNGGVAEHTEK